MAKGKLLIFSIVCSLLFITAFPVMTLPGAEIIRIGEFSQMKPGEDFSKQWTPLTFKKIKNHTRYDLVEEGGRVVVRAKSDNSASGMIRKMEVDPFQTPIIRWSWKVDSIIEKSDIYSKKGDDYPARIYVAFAYDPKSAGFWQKAKYEAARLLYGEYPPSGALNYIWAKNAEIETMTPNPFARQAVMVVVNQGREDLGKWVNHTRNVVQDYEAAFGKKPPKISGVAVMCDTDNTGEKATAFFGDIELVSEPLPDIREEEREGYEKKHSS